MDSIYAWFLKYKEVLYVALLMVLPFLYTAIHVPDPIVGKDAGQYYQYALNLVEGHGYSLDGVTFSNFREPVYPFFVAGIFMLFGAGNSTAVVIVQSLLLGLIGYCVYRLFVMLQKRTVGYSAGILTILIPNYGLYTHIYATELLFTFFLALLMLGCAGLLQHKTVGWYMLVGFLCGLATLTRVQLLFFLPFLIVISLLFKAFRTKTHLVRSGIALAVLAAMVGSWMLYIHSHIGSYALTQGRPEINVYIRATQAELSYGTLTSYGTQWLLFSLTNGRKGSPILDGEEIGMSLARTATTSDQFARATQWSMHTILTHPGTYLYGNFLELGRLLYIEHDYSDYLNRYVRAGFYLVLYSFTLFGLWWMLRKQTRYRTYAVLALLFIGYNALVLTPFVTIPRYNTPYLFLYVVIGFLGVLAYTERNQTLQ